MCFSTGCPSYIKFNHLFKSHLQWIIKNAYQTTWQSNDSCNTFIDIFSRKKEFLNNGLIKKCLRFVLTSMITIVHVERNKMIHFEVNHILLTDSEALAQWNYENDSALFLYLNSAPCSMKLYGEVMVSHVTFEVSLTFINILFIYQLK